MFTFLRSIDLDPIEWEEAIRMTEQVSPYTGNVLDVAFSRARAAVVLLTGDDLACLGQQYVHDHDAQYEKHLTAQARPNVIFEVGMAFGKYPNKTVIVEFGATRPFTDTIGRNTIRFSNDLAGRKKLADRLKSAGCAVNIDYKSDWMNAGASMLGKSDPVALG
jgi:predicted nucleotide-binding protein